MLRPPAAAPSARAMLLYLAARKPMALSTRSMSRGWVSSKLCTGGWNSARIACGRTVIAAPSFSRSRMPPNTFSMMSSTPGTCMARSPANSMGVLMIRMAESHHVSAGLFHWWIATMAVFS